MFTPAPEQASDRSSDGANRSAFKKKKSDSNTHRESIHAKFESVQLLAGARAPSREEGYHRQPPADRLASSSPRPLLPRVHELPRIPQDQEHFQAPAPCVQQIASGSLPTPAPPGPGAPRLPTRAPPEPGAPPGASTRLPTPRAPRTRSTSPPYSHAFRTRSTSRRQHAPPYSPSNAPPGTSNSPAQLLAQRLA